MARIDDLIAQLSDKALRLKIEGALADMRKRQRFGLVFEEHVPETSSLLGLPVTVGATVQRRADTEGKSLYQVTALLSRGRAKLEPEDGGSPETEAVKELLVVKRFGDPIFPALTSLGGIHNGPCARPHHAVINGENFHALQLLVYLYEGKVDCIYIDPPYNTGSRDWKYNNRYVDKKDAWRHSKWLSFMEKRLRLAKRLLKTDGVLIVTIDEHEVHHLGMLLERLFPAYLRHMVSIVINPKGTGKLNFARVDEYAIFCVPDLGQSIIVGEPTLPSPTETDESDSDDDSDSESSDEDEENDELPDEEIDLPFPTEEIGMWELRHARRRGSESSYRKQRKNQFYPIYIDESAGKVVTAGESLPIEQPPSFRRKKGLKPIWPIDKEDHERCWRFIPSKMNELIAEGRVVLGKYHKDQDTYTLNIWEKKPTSKKLKTVWWKTPHDAGTHGTSLLYKLLGKRDAFPFAKSVYAVKDCLAAVVRNRPNALILDFFAGSGTTLHATCLLNEELGGSRRSILVTNNEVAEKVAKRLNKDGVFRGDKKYESSGIFEQTTRPRCESVITGRRPDGKPIEGTYADGSALSKGFEENVEFFRIDYLDPDDVDLGNQFDAILPSLWLAAGAVGDRECVSDQGGFCIPPTSHYAVLFRESAFRKMRKALDSRPDITHIWIVTDSEGAFAEMRSALPGQMVTSMLYRDYLRNFRINTRHNL